MDYHKDRFHDHSLLIYDEKDRLIGIFPANEFDKAIMSHQGLSFGGLFYRDRLSTLAVMDAMDAILLYYRDAGFTTLDYKAIPWIYSDSPSEEYKYSLLKNNALLFRYEINSVIQNRGQFRLNKGKKWIINKSKKSALIARTSDSYEEYWALLTEVLQISHGVKPVHSLEEIQRLADRFPDNIELIEARDANQNLLAGIVLFITKNVVHTQYMANSLEGRSVGALDFLINNIIEDNLDKKIISFGISTEDGGKKINEGLLNQKEGFGASSIVHEFYRIKL